MQRVGSVPGPGQLDIFVPEREALEIHLPQLIERPTPELIQAVTRNLSILRVSPEIGASTLAVVADSMTQLQGKLRRSGSDADSLLLDAAGLGIEAAAVAGRFNTVDPKQKGLLYVRALTVMEWLETQRQASPYQLALPAARAASFFGHPHDIQKAYTFLDGRIRQLQADHSQRPALPAMQSVRARRAMIDLAVADHGPGIIERLQRTHIAEVPANPKLSPELQAVTSALDLAKIIGIAEANFGVARRVINLAKASRLPLDVDFVHEYYATAANTDRHTTDFVTQVTGVITAA